ncbi:hypothetical protein BS50DRAFT_570450 [Corynespora cassiicola Philippines]|uniref:Uncharacterized protein n=1 Tax=Corynespora cassiicola Philippines TaxID=1448308 RepID=A0A2T2P048_CORCC|nr:hypothetical protein BS50DRAFT_570450 [Corynespora cassiicola Philippines]
MSKVLVLAGFAEGIAEYAMHACLEGAWGGGGDAGGGGGGGRRRDRKIPLLSGVSR